MNIFFSFQPMFSQIWFTYCCFRCLGIERHCDEKGFGDWFKALQPILAERASNNPETTVEPGLEASTPRSAASTPPSAATPPPGKKRKGELPSVKDRSLQVLIGLPVAYITPSHTYVAHVRRAEWMITSQMVCPLQHQLIFMKNLFLFWTT